MRKNNIKSNTVYTDESILRFGKYKNRAIKEIPAEYFIFIKRHKCRDKLLLDWINLNLKQIENKYREELDNSIKKSHTKIKLRFSHY